MRRIALLAASLALAACASYEKLGDRAASAGDWRSAERDYAEAFREDPRNPRKRAKWERARAQALKAAGGKARADGGRAPVLDEVRAEHDRQLDAQAETAARRGDALLDERRFAEAAAQYEAAATFAKGGRAEPLARYSRALAAGEQAIRARDYPRAAQAYGEAVRTGMDTQGFAAGELERVRPRPYAIRVRSVLVKPIRPDGGPWAGPRSPGFDRVVGYLAAATLDGAGDGPHAALDLYEAVPRENRPNLVATLVLPDGRRFATTPRQAIHARLDSSVVVLTSFYDDRPVTIRLTSADPAGHTEVGAVGFRLMDLLAGHELQLAGGSILDLRVGCDPSPLADGAADGFIPLPAPVAVPPAAPGGPPQR